MKRANKIAESMRRTLEMLDAAPDKSSKAALYDYLRSRGCIIHEGDRN